MKKTVKKHQKCLSVKKKEKRVICRPQKKEQEEQIEIVQEMGAPMIEFWQTLFNQKKPL